MSVNVKAREGAAPMAWQWVEGAEAPAWLAPFFESYDDYATVQVPGSSTDILPGDWIVTTKDGALIPCGADAFDALFEVVAS